MVRNDKGAEGGLLSPGKLLDPLRMSQAKLLEQETVVLRVGNGVILGGNTMVKPAGR